MTVERIDIHQRLVQEAVADERIGALPGIKGTVPETAADIDQRDGAPGCTRRRRSSTRRELRTSDQDENDGDSQTRPERTGRKRWAIHRLLHFPWREMMAKGNTVARSCWLPPVRLLTVQIGSQLTTAN